MIDCQFVVWRKEGEKCTVKDVELLMLLMRSFVIGVERSSIE